MALTRHDSDKYKAWVADVYSWTDHNGLSFLVIIFRGMVDVMPTSLSLPIRKTPTPVGTDKEFADASEELTEEGEEGTALELPTTTRLEWCKPVDNIDQALRDSTCNLKTLLLTICYLYSVEQPIPETAPTRTISRRPCPC